MNIQLEEGLRNTTASFDPDRIAHLAVLDIAPFAYQQNHNAPVLFING
ncbi:MULTISPECIES: hypothetical protein [Acinetobacter]|jgi:hypothetical protein|uniref:Uncharacterized protein n=1 Tax=Acinetobacter entericus TaxID=2989714 RepID=A0ABT3NJ78_9GAMM|nr:MULTISPECIES: hypothetical protein [Acinetobacter]MCW8039602.1 hypothetical protein [Acinetobacter entericus]